ncbi:hypothetical protein [Subtercola sp. PAMC28395]|nr:hypothetical protein [Subtercola sp. PAMC28395]
MPRPLGAGFVMTSGTAFLPSESHTATVTGQAGHIISTATTA